MQAKGCTRILAKELSTNDNSKNQVYLGPDFDVLHYFPDLRVNPCDTGTHGPVFKSPLRFFWIQPDGQESETPYAQLILYPQYPEVRFSGFLKGAKKAPSVLMCQRLLGRVLLLGTRPDGNIYGYVVGPEDKLAAEFRAIPSLPIVGIFKEIPFKGIRDKRKLLLKELGRIHHQIWIDSKRLDANRHAIAYNAPNGGGYTLEAELGISPNGFSEPDFLGWEVKQHHVSRFASIEVGVLTLLTPEPTGGVYKNQGAEDFIRLYGYPDRRGRLDRMNFGGIHRFETLQNNTNLTLKLIGYDAGSRSITKSNGRMALLDSRGIEAASWTFAGLMEHWNRKHNQAVYVPSLSRVHRGIKQYCYGNMVRLGQGTDFLKFLNAVAAGVVYYDPGLKLENASSHRPVLKKRSQFRIASRSLVGLYENFNPTHVL